MPFSQATIAQVNPPTSRRGETHVSWVSSSPAGTWFQVYVNGKLAGATKKSYINLPASGDARFDIGTVANGEQFTDFSASLPAAPQRRRVIAWDGGSYLDPSGNGDVAGFYVYGSTTPAGYGTGGYGQGGYGTGQSTLEVLATIPAYTGPGKTDGYGMGGYGAGAYGSASASYSWTTDVLWSGLWTFAVAAFDASGNVGTVSTSDLTIQLPPREPGWGQSAPRLTYSLAGYGVGPYGGRGYGSDGYGSLGYGGGVAYGGSVASLSWQPSPGKPMTTSYTASIKLGEPAANDTGWATPLNQNFTTLDALNPVGDLFVTTHEQPSASLLVDVASGIFIDQTGTVQTYAGTSSYAIAASTTKVLYLDGTASWALTTGSSYPVTPHIRLATVVAGSSTISSITDNRLCFQYAGQRLPTVTHLLSTATAIPTIAAGSAAGTSPTVSVGASSTDVAGTVSITTGTSPGTGVLATITFNVAFGTAPRAILLTPANAATAGVAADVYASASGVSTTVFTINASVALAASTAYQWFFAVIG